MQRRFTNSVFLSFSCFFYWLMSASYGHAAVSSTMMDTQIIRSGLFAYGILDKDSSLVVVRVNPSSSTYSLVHHFQVDRLISVANAKKISMDAERQKELLETVKSCAQNNSNPYWGPQISLHNIIYLAKKTVFNGYFGGYFCQQLYPMVDPTSATNPPVYLLDPGNSIMGSSRMRLPKIIPPETLSNGFRGGEGLLIEPGVRGTSVRKSLKEYDRWQGGQSRIDVVICRRPSKWYQAFYPSLQILDLLSNQCVQMFEVLTIEMDWNTGGIDRSPALVASSPQWLLEYPKKRNAMKDFFAKTGREQYLQKLIASGMSQESAEYDVKGIFEKQPERILRGFINTHRCIYNEVPQNPDDPVTIQKMIDFLTVGDPVDELVKDFELLRLASTWPLEKRPSVREQLVTKTALGALDILSKAQWEISGLLQCRYPGRTSVWRSASSTIAKVQPQPRECFLWTDPEYLERTGPYAPMEKSQ